jgi:hypothetical protein
MSTRHQDAMQLRLVSKRLLWHCADMHPGITKTYKLTYESIEVMHALFDKSSASSEWTIKSGFLREFTDFFSPKAEQLDIYFDDGKVTFLGFTDKVVNTKHGMTDHRKGQKFTNFLFGRGPQTTVENSSLGATDRL